jgi:sugar (pentulose or hexulose) kinase
MIRAGRGAPRPAHDSETKARPLHPEGWRAVTPDAKSAAVYQELFPLYRKLYFALGQKSSEPAAIGEVLPELRRIAMES